MATLYVDSSATGTGDASSWANAATSVSTVSTSAGDLVLISSAHSEVLSSTWTLDNGTFANPVTLVSATAGTTTYEAGATLRGFSSSIRLAPGDNDCLVLWGLHLKADTASYSDLWLGAAYDVMMFYFDCTLYCEDLLYLTVRTDADCRFTDCTFTLDSATGEVRDGGTRAKAEVRGGSISAGQYDYAVRKSSNCETKLRAVDLSGYTSAFYNSSTTNGSQQMVASGCAVGSGFTANTATTTQRGSNFAAAEYCGTSSSAITTLAGLVDLGGETKTDTTRYRDSPRGATDAVTGEPYCHAVTCTTGTMTAGHESAELATRIDAPSGSTVILTVFLAGGATLTDEDFWLDCYLPPSGSTAQQHFTSTRLANPLATATELTADGSTWSGSGVGTRYKVSVTYSPTAAGIARIAPNFAKSSGTVYIDPRIEVEYT